MGNFNKKNKAGVNIGVGADTTQIQTAMQSVAASIAALTPVMREFNKSQKTTTDTIEKTTVATKGFSNTASLAGMNIMNLANLVSDLPYGFRGVANNLSYAMQMMLMLNNETKSLKGTFVALKQSLMGSGGILIAFNLLIAGIDYFIGNGKKAKETTEELTTAFTDQKAEAMGLFGHLEDLVKNGGDLNDIKRAAKEINEKYNTTIDAEKLTVKDLNGYYTDVIASIKQKLAIEAGGESISKGLKAQGEAEIRLIKAQAKEAEAKARFEKDAQEGFKRGFSSMRAYSDAIKEREKVEADIQEAINQQNIGLHAQTEARKKLDKLGLFEPEKEKKDKSDDKKDNWLREQEEINRLLEQENEIRIIESSNADKEILENKKKADLEYYKWLRELENEMFFGEIEITGEIFPKKQKEKLKNEIKEFGEEINALLEQYVVSAIVSLGEMIGEAMVLGKDVFGSNKDQMLESFADFLSKLGGMMIAFGITLTAFDESLKKGDGTVAIAAGIAAVIAAGAIKGYLKRKGDTALTGGGGGSGSSYSGANGYGGDGGDIVIYTRLDGRDLVMSGSRYQYVGRR